MEDRWLSMYIDLNNGSDVFPSSIVNFTLAKESYSPPSLQVTNSNELLYRFFKSDTRLVKAILENNNF